MAAKQEDIPAEFGVGDVVRIMSSTVKMTVAAVANGFIKCRWFDQTDDLLMEEFKPRELIVVKRREELP